MNSIRNVYEYLYFRSYSFYLNCFGKEDLPEYSASLSLGLKIIINILTILPWVLTPNVFIKIPYVYIIIFCIIILSGNIFLFNYKNYYKDIYNKYKAENKHKKYQRRTLVWIYNFLTITLLVLSVYFSKIYK